MLGKEEDECSYQSKCHTYLTLSDRYIFVLLVSLHLPTIKQNDKTIQANLVFERILFLVLNSLISAQSF